MINSREFAFMVIVGLFGCLILAFGLSNKNIPITLLGGISIIINLFQLNNLLNKKEVNKNDTTKL